MLICLDTDVLRQFPERGQRKQSTFNEYQTILKLGGVFTKWEHILYTDHNLILSPFSLWEFSSVDLECLHKNKIPYNLAFSIANEHMNVIEKRFGVSSKIETKTFLIGVLFGASTGVSCDDAFHFVYPIKKNAKIFATNNKSDFSFLLKNYDKNEIINKMLDLLYAHDITSFFSELKIKSEIKKLEKQNWPTVYVSPADIPYQ